MAKITDEHLKQKITNVYDYIYEEYFQRMNVPIELGKYLSMIIIDKVIFYITKNRKISMFHYIDLMGTKVALDLIIQFNNYSNHYGIEKFLKYLY